MWQKIVSFFTSIIAFIMSLFGMSQAVVTEYKNVSYGGASIQKMDVYYPDAPEKLNKDVGAILLIHGGAWSAGSKENYTSVAKQIAEKGYVAVTMNYRMLQHGATYVEMIEDIDLAIAKLKEKTEADGVSVKKLAVAGASAGGHLSLLYSYTHLNGTDSAPAIPIAFTVGAVAPTDFTDPAYEQTAYTLDMISGLIGVQLTIDNLEENRALIEQASPLYHATAAAPPTILCYGGQDTLVPLSNGLSMKAALEEMNVPYKWYLFPNSGHDLSDSRDSGVRTQVLVGVLEYAVRYF
ncbi:MAG: alpha/beta hydrolase [Oscillospiraceae bacterium]|nr:alpha/beta hydrolase [Oscillospiraceae bacterium]